MKITHKNKVYYSTKELSEHLGYTRRHTRWLTDKKGLSYIVVERWRLYPVDEANEFIAKHRR